jgi:hypothetical protein
MTHLDIARALLARLGDSPATPGALLQAARDLDAKATNHPPGSMLTGSGSPGRWFGFTLAFSADSGADLDTVRASLGLSPGWVVHVEYDSEDGLDRLIADVVFSALEQDDDPAADFPVFLVGHRYDDSHTADNDYRGEPVRIPLAGARITIY